MRPQQKRIAIISACVAGNSQAKNDKADTELGIDLQRLDLSHSACVGVYKGQHENSYLVVINHDYEIDLLTTLGSKYSQESILFSDQDRNTRLYFCATADTVDLGVLRAVESVEGLTAYTMVLINGVKTYFSTE